MAPRQFWAGLTAMLLALEPASAVTPISNAEMERLQRNGGGDLAYNYAPVWFFGESKGNLPCIPDWAYGGSPTKPDTYKNSSLTPPAKRCKYPDVGCDCRNPPKERHQETAPFPIYYSWRQCSATEVRVAYNLFYQKDGAIADLPLGIHFDIGHNWDWERIIVIHTKDTKTNTWAPSEALYSAHSGYKIYKWGDIQNTVTTRQAEAGQVYTPNGVKNHAHPKAYVAWAKHANYDDRNTGFNGVGAQTGVCDHGDEAFRSDDWWYFVARKYFIRADPSTAAGKAMMAFKGWGEADSIPPKVHEQLCSTDPAPNPPESASAKIVGLLCAALL